MTTIPARRQFLRDAAAATAGVVGPYGLSVGVQFAPVQVPGYRLVVGFDAVETLVGPFARYDLAFGAYLGCLGLASGAVATLARRVGGERWRLESDAPVDGEGPGVGPWGGWRVGAASTLAVVGAGALLLSLWTLASTSQPARVAVAAATGLVLLAGAGWTAGPLRSASPQ